MHCFISCALFIGGRISKWKSRLQPKKNNSSPGQNAPDSPGGRRRAMAVGNPKSSLRKGLIREEELQVGMEIDDPENSEKEANVSC